MRYFSCFQPRDSVTEILKLNSGHILAPSQNVAIRSSGQRVPQPSVFFCTWWIKGAPQTMLTIWPSTVLQIKENIEAKTIPGSVSIIGQCVSKHSASEFLLSLQQSNFLSRISRNALMISFFFLFVRVCAKKWRESIDERSIAPNQVWISAVLFIFEMKPQNKRDGLGKLYSTGDHSDP